MAVSTIPHSGKCILGWHIELMNEYCPLVLTPACACLMCVVFSQFVLIPPSRYSSWPFGGVPCDLSEVDLFGAEGTQPVPSECVGISEGVAQPEGTRTGGGVFVGWRSEWLSLSCMNCRQSVAVFDVFNMSCNSIVFPYSHSLPQMSTSLHHQWSTTPVWGSWLLMGAVSPLPRELWRGWQGDMVWRNWLWLKWVSVFNALSFHCTHWQAVLNHAPPNRVSLLCIPRLSLANLSSQKEMTAESVLEITDTAWCFPIGAPLSG